MDNLTALTARDDLLWIAAHWNDLHTHLRPGGGNALTGVTVTTSDTGHAPINIHVSDLLHEIEWKIARFYAGILADETDWTPTTSTMPGLLREVAERYGHFTNDPTIALGFCDDAHDYRHRVTRTLERPAPPTYVGPCQNDNCHGELYLKTDHEEGRCTICQRPFTLTEQRDYINREMQGRLMTQAELPRALNILGLKVAPGTVRKWVERHKLTPAIEGEHLYRLADAKTLAETTRRHTNTNVA